MILLILRNKINHIIYNMKIRSILQRFFINAHGTISYQILSTELFPRAKEQILISWVLACRNGTELYVLCISFT